MGDATDSSGQPTDGKPPDFEAMYAYAALFIDLGDRIYEYAHNVIESGFTSATWSGDRLSAANSARDTLTPLVALLASSDQHGSVPSAARLLWNVGQSINWFAVNLEEQRAEEKKENIAELIAVLVGFAVMGLFTAFSLLPATAAIMAEAMSWLGNVISTVLETLWTGVEWLGIVGRGLGDAITGAILGVGTDLVSTVISQAAVQLDIHLNPTNLIIDAVLGGAVGVLFGNDIRQGAASLSAVREADKILASNEAKLEANNLPKSGYTLSEDGLKQETLTNPHDFGAIRPNELPKSVDGLTQETLTGPHDLGVIRPNELPTTVDGLSLKAGGDGVEVGLGTPPPDRVVPADSLLDKINRFVNPPGPAVQKAAAQAEYRAQVDALRAGDSPLPPAEATRWQEGLAQFKGKPAYEQKFMEQYAQRVDEYQSLVPARIPDSGDRLGANITATSGDRADVVLPSPPRDTTTAEVSPGIRDADFQRRIDLLNGGPREQVNDDLARSSNKSIDDVLGRLKTPEHDPTFDARRQALRDELQPTAGSIDRLEAHDRLTRIDQELGQARAETIDEAAGQGPATHSADQKALQNRVDALGRDDHLGEVPRLPDAPVHEVRVSGANDLHSGLERTIKDARSAGLPEDQVSELAAAVDTKIQTNRLGEAAQQLGVMRREIDQFQLGRNLDHFRAHFDAGHPKAAELGMDKVTWLQRAQAIESAAADGREGDLRALLDRFEVEANHHLKVLQLRDLRVPDRLENVSVDQARQARIDALGPRPAPPEPADGGGTPHPPETIERLRNLPKPPSDDVEFNLSADRLDALRSEPIDGPAAAEWQKVLRADAGAVSEADALNRLETFHQAIQDAGYNARLEALLDGKSPLPRAEAEIWQKAVHELRGKPDIQRAVLDEYAARLDQYDAQVRRQIENVASAPDRSRPLNVRLQEKLDQISQQTRTEVARENLSPSDRLARLRDADLNPGPDRDLPPIEGADRPPGAGTGRDQALPSPPSHDPAVRVPDAQVQPKAVEPGEDLIVVEPVREAPDVAPAGPALLERPEPGLEAPSPPRAADAAHSAEPEWPIPDARHQPELQTMMDLHAAGLDPASRATVAIRQWELDHPGPAASLTAEVRSSVVDAVHAEAWRVDETQAAPGETPQARSQRWDELIAQVPARLDAAVDLADRAPVQAPRPEQATDLSAGLSADVVRAAEQKIQEVVQVTEYDHNITLGPDVRRPATEEFWKDMRAGEGKIGEWGDRFRDRLLAEHRQQQLGASAAVAFKELLVRTTGTSEPLSVMSRQDIARLAVRFRSDYLATYTDAQTVSSSGADGWIERDLAPLLGPGPAAAAHQDAVASWEASRAEVSRVFAQRLDTTEAVGRLRPDFTRLATDALDGIDRSMATRDGLSLAAGGADESVLHTYTGLLERAFDAVWSPVIEAGARRFDPAFEQATHRWDATLTMIQTQIRQDRVIAAEEAALREAVRAAFDRAVAAGRDVGELALGTSAFRADLKAAVVALMAGAQPFRPSNLPHWEQARDHLQAAIDTHFDDLIGLARATENRIRQLVDTVPRGDLTAAALAAAAQAWQESYVSSPEDTGARRRERAERKLATRYESLAAELSQVAEKPPTPDQVSVPKVFTETVAGRMQRTRQAAVETLTALRRDLGPAEQARWEAVRTGFGNAFEDLIVGEARAAESRAQRGGFSPPAVAAALADLDAALAGLQANVPRLVEHADALLREVRHATNAFDGLVTDYGVSHDTPPPADVVRAVGADHLREWLAGYHAAFAGPRAGLRGPLAGTTMNGLVAYGQRTPDLAEPHGVPGSGAAVRDTYESEADEPMNPVPHQPRGEQPLAPDVQRIADLAVRAAADLAEGSSSLLRAVFDQRFALGVKLKGATAGMPGARTGSQWLFTEAGGDGPGWQQVQSWDQVAVIAGTAGTGGLTMFASARPDVAVFVHNARDGVSRVIEVHADGHQQIFELDDYRSSQAAPAAVVAIDQCAEVHA